MNSRKLFVLTVAFVALAGVTRAQTAQFEVASIHEVVDGVRVIDTFTSAGNRAEYHGFGIQSLIAEAWNARGDQVALGSGVSPQTVYPMMDAGRSARIYEIVAQAAEGTTPTRDEFRLMVRSLLASRFKLVTHTEKRDLPVYVLSSNGTPRLKASAGEGTCSATASRVPDGQKMAATHCPIEVLVRSLFVDRPIYDETGLTGSYDFEVTSALPFQRTNPEAITPFIAVKEFGLKLEAKQRQVDFIVIDHVEPPGEN